LEASFSGVIMSVPSEQIKAYIHMYVQREWYVCIVNSTSDYMLWTLYRSYFKGISGNIELQVHSVTCC
jgi:hypothetical protein